MMQFVTQYHLDAAAFVLLTLTITWLTDRCYLLRFATPARRKWTASLALLITVFGLFAAYPLNADPDGGDAFIRRVSAEATGIIIVLVVLMASCVSVFTSEILGRYRDQQMRLELQTHELTTALRRQDVFQFAINSHAIFMTTDIRGVITFANERLCRISGYSSDELVGARPHIMNSGYHDGEFWEKMWQAIRAGEVWGGEVCNRRKNGTQFWIKNTIVPYLDDSGKICQFVSIELRSMRRAISRRIDRA
ncbi:MAG: PAS domain-containing protein, partial [Planctomycetaceae bacterium]